VKLIKDIAAQSRKKGGMDMDIQKAAQQAMSNVVTPSKSGTNVNITSAPEMKKPEAIDSAPVDTSSEQPKQQSPDDQQLAKSSEGVAERVLIEAIEKANRKSSGASAQYSFSVHEATKQIMIKVTDKDTGEVIKEIPSQKALDAIAMMWEFAGLMVDEKR